MKLRYALFIAVALILGLSFYIRVILPYNQVMPQGQEVRFTTVDAYAHLRMADWEYTHFPETMKSDSFLNYPDGTNAPARPLWSWIIAGISKVAGIPLDLVAAWLPAILGVLIALWVFIIGWLVFNKWAGLIAALFVAVIPGELVGRTSLGHTDHDSFEINLLLMVLTFLILAIKRKWYWAIGAGIFLGLYNLNWAGAPLFTLMLCVYFVIQSVIDKYRNKLDYNLYRSFFISFLFGVVVYVLLPGFRIPDINYILFFTASYILPIGLFTLNYWLVKVKPQYYLLALLAGAVTVGLLLTLVVNNVWFSLYQSFSAFLPQLTGFGTTISEMMPLFWNRGQVDFITPWAYYGLCLYSGLIGMVVYIWKNWREPHCLMIGMWSIMTIVMVMIQRRYGIYSAISMSLYTGYLCWVIVKGIGIKRLTRADRKRGKAPVNIGYVVMTSIVLILFLFIPVYLGATRTAVQLPYVITDSWMDGLKWLKTNTPQVNESKPEYSVLSWWDYGYWIVREGKRPTIISPGGGNINGMSKFLLMKTGDVIDMPILKDNTLKKMNIDEVVGYYKIKYIVIDYQMVTGKFYAIPEGAGVAPNKKEDTLIYKLWVEGKYSGYEKVWQSNQKYQNDSQLKIYEYKGVANIGS